MAIFPNVSLYYNHSIIHQPVVSSPDSNLSAVSAHTEDREQAGPATRTPVSASRARKRIYSSENDAKQVHHGMSLCLS